MKNKKGFTLIELLAVIIILGVLMIIAIPSVTEYISSSRKKAYIDTAGQYISTVVTKVNQAEKLKFFEPNTLYLVKVGHEDACVSLEKGGQSPFNDTWTYAYVGVEYTGGGYNYFFMSRDASGQGIKFTEQDKLVDADYDTLVTTDDIPNFAGNFTTTVAYTVKDDGTLCVQNGSSCDVAPDAFKGLLTNNTKYQKLVVVNNDGCTWN